MDILSARKKAAARAKAKKEKKAAPAPEPEPPQAEEQQPAPPVEQRAPVMEAPPAVEAAMPEAAPAVEEAEPQEEIIEEIPELELLAFRMGSEAYAVAVENVREVLKLWDVTAVPHTPAYILGVMPLRGSVLPVMDLSKRLGLGDGTIDDRARVIVASLRNEETGLLVEQVTGVVRIPADEVKPAPETAGQGAEAEFLQGIARKNDALFILLDLEKVLE